MRHAGESGLAAGETGQMAHMQQLRMSEVQERIILIVTDHAEVISRVLRPANAFVSFGKTNVYVPWSDYGFYQVLHGSRVASEQHPPDPPNGFQGDGVLFETKSRSNGFLAMSSGAFAHFFELLNLLAGITPTLQAKGEIGYPSLHFIVAAVDAVGRVNQALKFSPFNTGSAVLSASPIFFEAATFDAGPMAQMSGKVVLTSPGSSLGACLDPW